MRLSHFAPKIGLALLLSMGCSDEQKASGTDNKYDPFKVCTRNCTDPDTNGPDPFQPMQGIVPNYTMYPDRNAWAGHVYRVTGVYFDRTNKRWMARGYHRNPATLAYTMADAKISVGHSDGIAHQMTGFGGPPTFKTMAVSFCKDVACTEVITVQDSEVATIQLLIDAPFPAALGPSDNTHRFVWTFEKEFRSPTEITDLYSGDNLGVHAFWETKGLAPQALCQAPGGLSHLLFAQEHMLVDPTTAAITVNPEAVTLACELGAITVCKAWGFWENYDFRMRDGSPADKFAIQNTCMQMKLANYCGNKFQTKLNTKIVIQDSVDAPRFNGVGSVLEAVWTPTGALCDNGQLNHRHPEIPTACAVPTCTAADWATKSDFVSSLPY